MTDKTPIETILDKLLTFQKTKTDFNQEIRTCKELNTQKKVTFIPKHTQTEQIVTLTLLQKN